MAKRNMLDKWDDWSSEVEPESIERVIRSTRFLLLIPLQPILWPLRTIWNWAERCSAPKVERERKIISPPKNPIGPKQQYHAKRAEKLRLKPPPWAVERKQCKFCGGKLCHKCLQARTYDVYTEFCASIKMGQVILCHDAWLELLTHRSFNADDLSDRFNERKVHPEGFTDTFHLGTYKGVDVWRTPELPDNRPMAIWRPTEFKQVIPGVLVERLAPGEKLVNPGKHEGKWSVGVEAADAFRRKAAVNSRFAAFQAKRAERDIPPPIAWINLDMSCVSVRHPDGGITVITMDRLFERWGQPDDFIRQVNARQSIERSELTDLLGL